MRHGMARGALAALVVMWFGVFALAQDSGDGEVASPAPIRFNFKDAPVDALLDLFARQTGLPVIREVDVPGNWSITYISASDYDLEEALSVLNTILQTKGFVLQQSEQFLFFRKLESVKPHAPVVSLDEVGDRVSPEQLVTVVVPLNNALAKDLAEQIKPLIRGYGQAVALPTQNSIILTESARQIGQLRRIIETIDAKPAFEETIRIFPLKHITPEEAMSSIKVLISERQKTVVLDPKGKRVEVENEMAPGVRLEANESTNSIIALGPEGRLKTIGEIIELIDVPGDGGVGRQMATFLLESLTASEAKKTVDSLFQAMPEDKRPTTVPLTTTNKLTIIGNGASIAQAGALLSEMDPSVSQSQDDPGGPPPSRIESKTEVVELAHAEAPAAIEAARRLMTPRQANAMRLAPAPGGRGVIIVGTPADCDSLRALLSAIDRPAGDPLDARIVSLNGRTSAAAIAKARELFDATAGEGGEPVRVDLDEESGFATLIGPRDALDRFARLLETAEGASGVTRQMRTYTVDAMQPSALSQKLSRLAKAMLTPADGSPYEAPSFEPADDIDTLVVRATPEQFGVIESLIDALSDPNPGAKQFRVVDVPSGDPAAIAGRAEALFDELGAGLPADAVGEVAWRIDPATGHLLITADEPGMRRFTSLLAEVQRLTPPARSTELIELEFADASRILEPLRTLVTATMESEAGREMVEPTIQPAPSGNALLVTGEPTQLALVREHLRRLDVLEPGDLPPLRLLTIRSADVNAVALMLRDQYAKRSVEERRLKPVDFRAEPSTNTLIVSAGDQDFEEIKAFVDGLNTPETEADRVTEIFPLKVAKAQDVASAMQKLYPDPPMPVDRRGNPLPHLKEPREVNVSADPASNTLIVDAPAERIPAFKALVEKLDRVELPPAATLRTYRIERADINAVAATLNAMARQGVLSAQAQPGKPSVPVTVQAEPVSGTLIVAGDDTTHEQVESILADLSAVPIERGLRVVRLANADPNDVAQRAMTIYDQQVADVPSAGTVDVSVSAQTNSLMVVADDESMARFLRILDELENQAGPPRELRLIELQHTTAADAVAFLNDLLESTRPFTRSGGVDPVFEAIERNNAIMVAAQDDQHAIIDSLVRSIDVPSDATTEPLRILRLRTAEATNIERVLTQAYSSRPAEERAAKPVTIRADANTNSLIVSAHPALLPEISQIIEDLNDVQSYDAEGREISIFPLKVARAEELARTIDQMYPEPPVPLDSRGRPLPHLKQPREVVVRADAQTNSLIVDAPAKRMSGFQELVRQLDRAEVSREMTLRTYRIERADVEAVAGTLRKLASSGGLDMGDAGPRQAQVVIEAEAASRTLVVSAPPSAFTQIEAVIEEFEGGLAGLETDFAFFQLTNARADRVAPVMQKLLLARLRAQVERDGGRLDDEEGLLEVVADQATNSLIVTAPTSVLDAAREIVGRLDTDATAIGRDVVRIVPLVFAEAAPTADALERTLARIDLPSGGEATVTAAAGSNALVLSGAELDVEYLLTLINELDVAPKDESVGVRTVYLKHGRAEAIAPIVERLLKGEQLDQWMRWELARRGNSMETGPDVRVEAEPRLNAVVITAPREVLAVAEEVVAQLDVEGGAATRPLRIFTLTNATAADVAQNLEAVFEESGGQAPPTVRVDQASNSLIVRGGPDQLEAIGEVVSQLDEATIAGSRQMRTVPMDRSRVDAATMALTLQRLLKERGGVKVEVISADELLKRSQPGADEPDQPEQTGTPTSRLDNPIDDSTSLELARRKILIPKRLRLIIGYHGMALAQAGALEADEESADVTIAIDPVTNSLILLGSSRATDRVAELALLLQQQMPGEPGRIRIVELPEGADADHVGRLVNATVSRIGRAGLQNPGGLTGDVGVIPDPVGGSLIVASNDTDFDTLTGLIAAVASPGRSTAVTVKVYPLETVEGWRAAQAVSDFVLPTPRGRQARRVRNNEPLVVMLTEPDGTQREVELPSGSVRATAGPNGRSLIVAAPVEALPVIDRFVAMLDQSPVADDQMIREYALEHADAAQAARTLQQAFEAARVAAGAPRGTEARFVADARTNTLLVTASGDQHTEVTRLLTTLDGEMDPMDGRPLEMIRLQTAQAGAVAQTIQRVIVGNDPARQDRITITGDNALGVLFVRAPEEELAQIRELVASVDQSDIAELPIRTITLERADAEQVATQLQRFLDDRAKTSTTPGQRSKSRRVSITGDRRSGTLIVAATDDDFTQVETLARSLDNDEEFGELEFRVIELKHARAGEVSGTLLNLRDELQWIERSRARSGRGGSDQDAGVVTLEADTRTNAIVLIGRGKALETMTRVVESVDRPQPDTAGVVVRVFKVERANLGVVERAAEQAFASGNSSRRWWEPPDPTELRIEVDEQTRSLIAIGPAAKLDGVGALIAQLDEAVGDTGELLVETIALQHADAARAAQSVARFFQERARLEGQDRSPVSVIGSRDGNALIVTAPGAEFPLVRDIIAKLDQSDLAGDRLVEIVTLEFATADGVSRAIRDIFQSRGGPAERRVITSPDSRTNALVIASPGDLMEEVLAVVRQLDAQDEGEVVTLQTFNLQAARAEEVARTLTEALNLDEQASGRGRALQQQVQKFTDQDGQPITVKARITPDRRSNTLLVSADERSMQLIASLIGQLDEQPSVSPLVYKIIPLKHALAIDVAMDLRTLVRSLPREAGVPEPSITSSDHENTIMVAATSDQLIEIEGLLAQLDQPPLEERITEFVPLRFADAAQVQEALRVFYGRTSFEAQTPGARNVSIVADPSTNSLVISAEESEWPGIRNLLEKLDSQEYDTARQLEVIALQHADAQSVARAIQQAFEAPLQAELERERQRQREEARTRGNNRFNDFFDPPSVLVDSEEVVSVSAEPMTNSLIVSAGRNDMDKIKAIVTSIDVADFARMPAPEIIPVRAGKPSTLAGSLRQLYEYRGTGQRGGSSRSVSIVGDDASGTIIVRANDGDLAQIRALAETLQQQGELTQVGVRILALHRQPAARVAGTLQRTFSTAAQERGERLAIETDRQTNALVIASSQELFEEIEAVVREVDGPAPGAGEGGLPTGVPGQGLFIIDVQHLSPDQVREQLEALGVTRPQPPDSPGVVSEPVVLLPLATRSSIAVLASPIDGPVVTSLVRALDAEPVGGTQEIALVRLSVASAGAVAATLREMVDPSQTAARTRLSESLAEQVRRLRMTSQAIGQGDIEVDLSAPIRIEPDAQTNAVLIASTPANVTALRELTTMLDRLPQGDAVLIRIFHLENASAQRLSQVVQQLFSQGEALRRAPGTQLRGLPTTETGRALAGEIAVTVDDRTNALIVAGREEAVALAEVLITQLDGDSTANWIEPVLIPLKHADAARLADTLREVLIEGVDSTPEAASLQRQVGRLRILRRDGNLNPQGLTESQIFAPMSQLNILAEEVLNAIIAVGSTANVEVVKALVEQLDVEGASRSDMVRIYPLRHAAADRVAGLLRDLFDQQVRADAIREEDSLTVEADSRTNSLIIATSPRSFALVDSLLDTLDADGEVFSTVGLHVIPAGANDASTLAPKLQSLMRDRLRAAERSGGATEDVVSIQSDEATNSLIVAASNENLEVIRDLMRLLAEGEASGDQGIEVFTLKTANAEDMVDLLEELYVDEVRRTRGDAALRVRADARLNAVVVNGSPADIDKIRQLIEQMDGDAISLGVREIKIIPLQSANALEVVSLLQNVLAGQTLSGRGASDRQATILRFFRSTTRETLEDVKGAAPTETEVSSAIREQVTLTPDVRTNSVVVNAPPGMNMLIQELIQEFESSPGGQREIEVFHLTNADADNMRVLLQDLFNLQRQGQAYVLTPAGAAQGGDGEDDPAAFTLGDTTLTVVPDERQQLAITVDARTNTLLVSGTQEYLSLVRKVVAELDEQPGAQRVQFALELKNARVEDVAPALQQFIDQEQDRMATLLGPDRTGSVLRQLESEISVVGVPGTSRLIVSSSPRYETTIRGLIDELDRAPAQVKIRVLLAEVTLDTEESWGLDFGLSGIGSRNVGGAFTAAGTGVATAIGVPNFAVASADFDLLVRALQVQGRLEVLSRPEVTVNDNEEAEINVGEEIQIVTGVTTLNDGRLQSTVEPRNVGVILTVTPNISPDGFVRLDIAPEISALSQRTTQISEDFEAPVISQRRAETTVTVRDGQTIVIGGLIQNQNDTRKTKVPFLGDIPGVGHVFRTEQTTSVRTELLIILTPQVIVEDRDMAGRTTDEMTSESLEELTKPETLIELLPQQFRTGEVAPFVDLPPASEVKPTEGPKTDPKEADGW